MVSGEGGDQSQNKERFTVKKIFKQKTQKSLEKKMGKNVKKLQNMQFFQKSKYEKATKTLLFPPPAAMQQILNIS